MSTLNSINEFARGSATIKLIGVALLALLLLIPASLVDSLIYERQQLRDQAVNEIASTWGGPQRLVGPVLQVPYTQTLQSRSSDQDLVESGSAYFLPDQLTLDGSTTSEQRYRGIYVAVLYTGQVRVSGRFDSLAIERLAVNRTDLDWSRARLSFGVEDLRGIDSLSTLEFGTQRLNFEPGTPAGGIVGTGFQASVNLDPSASDLRFAFDLSVRGSSALTFMPLAARTSVRLKSDWDTPKFVGAFLPDERTVDDTGFGASWTVLEVNRPFAQEGTRRLGQPPIQPLDHRFRSAAAGDDLYYIEPTRMRPTEAGSVSFDGYDFGVQYLLPVDEYRKIERSAKYSALFIAATFLTFFFIEVLNRRRLHPVQYLLVGFAIVLFYILLLSLSEHVGFDLSYLISVSLILGMVTAYSYAVLRNIKLAVLVMGILGLLYGFFYSLLQLEEYSLLLGSFGLLAALATVMYLTRGTNWYKLSLADPAD